MEDQKLLYFEKLRSGTQVWNHFISELRRPSSFFPAKHDQSFIHLAGVDLDGLNLEDAWLQGINLQESSLRRCRLGGAVLSQAILSGCDFSESDLSCAFLTNANLERSVLHGTKLQGTNLSRANMTGSVLDHADLYSANLSEATLQNSSINSTNLRCAIMTRTDLRGSRMLGCDIYGVSAWDILIDQSTQQYGLLLGESKLEIDDIRVGQFLTLLLDNPTIRDVVDTISCKIVVIIGRFSSGRKEVLNGIRNQLRGEGLVPVMFDFEKPYRRDTIEIGIVIQLFMR